MEIRQQPDIIGVVHSYLGTNLMKNVLGLLIFLVVACGLGFFVYYQGTSICRNPLDYAIGTVDGRFGIDQKEK